MASDDDRAVVDLDGLQVLIDVLDERGFDVYGPEARDGTIATRRLTSVDQLPVGWTLAQWPGWSKLEHRDDRARFGWAIGPQSWKPLVHPPRVRTMTMAQPAPDEGVLVSLAPRPARPMALFGMRPCDLAALGKLDRVLVDTPDSPEPTYLARRTDLFSVVVNCGSPASTCFCTSVGTGPHVPAGSDLHDIEITELLPGDGAPDREPAYLIGAVSPRGREVLSTVLGDRSVRAVGVRPEHLAAAEESREAAEQAMWRGFDAERVPLAVTSSHDDERWIEIGDRCLACGNCTAVCPTCFCTGIEDVGDLEGAHVDRWRRWDSCFGLEFSRVGPATIRSSIAARYRQWLTHKLGSWHDQFDESGCVGCGRCIAWCPVGIDLSLEARKFVVDHEAAE